MDRNNWAIKQGSRESWLLYTLTVSLFKILTGYLMREKLDQLRGIYMLANSVSFLRKARTLT